MTEPWLRAELDSTIISSHLALSLHSGAPPDQSEQSINSIGQSEQSIDQSEQSINIIDQSEADIVPDHWPLVWHTLLAAPSKENSLSHVYTAWSWHEIYINT